MNDTTFIYALLDPRDNSVRYVGKADDPYRRYCEHLKENYDSHKCRWIKVLMGMGLLPIRQILEECDCSIWQEREKERNRLKWQS